METNPYAAPQAESQVDPLSISALGELVKGWEKLRLIYNVVLLLPGAALMAYFVINRDMPAFAAIMFALASGVAANLAFFAGPIAELYFRAVFNRGKESPMLRRFLFGLGLIVSFGAMLFFSIGIVLT